MLAITELLEPAPVPLWRIVKPAGVDLIVSLLDGGEQQWRWPKAGAQHLVPRRYEASPPGERPWELPAFEGPMRPDHVPALEGESGDTFGYPVLGRLFAIGYITGLREAVAKLNGH